MYDINNKIAKSDLIDTTTKRYCKILRTDICKRTVLWDIEQTK